MNLTHWSLGIAAAGLIVFFVLDDPTRRRDAAVSDAAPAIADAASGTPPLPAAEAAPALAAPLRAASSDELSGRWAGELRSGPGEPVRFSFDLRIVDGRLAGAATFPIGTAPIEDGRIDGDRVTFRTRHQLPANGRLLLSSFSGERHGGTLALDMNSEGGVSKLSVERIARTPP